MRLNMSWKAAGVIAAGLALTAPAAIDFTAAMQGAPTVGDALREAGREPVLVRLTGMTSFTPQSKLEGAQRIFIADCESVGTAGGSASVPSLRAAYTTDYASTAPLTQRAMLVEQPHQKTLAEAIRALPKDCGQPYTYSMRSENPGHPTGYWPAPQGYTFPAPGQGN